MKKLFILLMACLSLAVQGHAQAPDVLPQVFSPNAAELGKYGKVPVSYFNGLPNISIPLTELKAKDYTLPIYLTYHAGGNKPEQHPGWVGQGWTLHAGGCINRIIKGCKDELIREDQYKVGYLYHADELDSLYKHGCDVLSPLSLCGNWDCEPDEYQINVDGINASFYFTGKGEIKIVSKSDIDFSVNYSLNEGANTFYGSRALDYKIKDMYVVTRNSIIEFCIVSKDGTKYYFGGSEDSIEYSIIPTYCVMSTNPEEERQKWDLEATANTWMLTKIERPNGEEILFRYERAGIPVVVVDSHRADYAYYEGHERPGINTFINPRSNYCFYFLLPTYLKTINCKYSSSSVTFNTGVSTQLCYDHTRNLFSDVVGDPDLYDYVCQYDYYPQLERIDFNKIGAIYFDYSKDDGRRLNLDSLVIKALSCSPKRYKFSYNTENHLPRYNSRQIDAWGFYNSKEPNSPRQLGLFKQARMVVEPDLLQSEILTDIQYPTGGRTHFEYEPHDYSQVVDTVGFGFILKYKSGQAGGLRVKKITDYAPHQQPNERLFTYTRHSGESSGILAGTPQYYAEGNVNLSDGVYDIQDWLTDTFMNVDDETMRYFYFSENPLRQLSLTDGSHVSYSMVTEYKGESGSVEYLYSNHDTPEMKCMDQKPFAVNSKCNSAIMDQPFNSMALNRGLLLKKKVFNKNGNMVLEECLNYAQDTSDCFLSRNEFVHFFSKDIYRVSLTKIFSYYPALSRKVVTTYPDNGGAPLVEETDYEYNNHRQLIKTTRRIGSRVEETRTLYSGDTSLANRSPYGEMQEHGIMDRPVEQTVLRNGRVVSSTLITYQKSGSQYLPDKYYETELSSPLNKWTPYNGTSFSSVYGNPKLSFDSYDSHGNILLATQEGGTRSRFYWDSAGYHPEASYTGMLVPVCTVQVEDTEQQSMDFQRKSLSEYTYEFDAERSGEFSFWMAWPECIAYDMSGTLDGNMVFEYQAPKQRKVGTNGSGNKPSHPIDGPILTPLTELYSGAISTGHHVFKIHPTGELQHGSNWAQLDVFLAGEGTISYPIYRSEVRTEDIGAWYYSFEKEEGSCSIGFKSAKGWRGSRTFSQTIPSGVQYSIDWMERGSNGEWSYHSKAFFGTSSIGSSSSIIDNVRIYPADVAATSWTWNNLGDLSSVTDGRGITEYYEYDGLGRLTTITDMDGHKKASYAYHYVSASDSTNYVRTNLYTDELGQKVRSTINYFDGLGRPWQTVRVNAGNDEEHPHLAEKTDYDAAGRPFLTWLPFRTSSLLPQVETPLDSLYSDSKPYSFIEYDGSPLDRPIAEYGPGADWHASGKAVRHAIYTNDVSTTLRCVEYTLNWVSDTTVVINRNRTIPSATLSVESVKDEDGLELLTFKDLYGQTILERRHPVSGENLDTYYIYDGLGHLSAVLPPELSKKAVLSHSDINNYAYLYCYDARGNCIAKKLPGCGWSFMVYDARGTMVMSQDAEQRKAGQWTLTLTDGQGRQCLSGTCTATLNVFGNPYGSEPVYVRRTNDSRVLQDYYGYTLYGLMPQNFIINQGTLWSPSGPAERFNRVLGPASEGKMLTTTYDYDTKGRIIWTEAETHLGGYETEEITYSFTDDVLTRWHTIYTDSNVSSSEQYTYTYDHWGRPLKALYCGDGGEIVLHDNVYDELGRLVADKRNGESILSTTYTYNVRSWLTGIQSEFFSEALSYETRQAGVTPQWGGSISKMTWRSGIETHSRQYAFTYDGYGRLTGAAYDGGSMGGNYSAAYSYDANSNLSKATRIELTGMRGNETFEGQVISYPRTGNQVILRGPSNILIPIGANGKPLYQDIYYDSCGRMVKDKDQGIRQITYNELHLPSSIDRTKDGISYAQYGVQYAADGRKLRTGRLGMETNGQMYFETPTDYIGNLVCKDGVLDKVLFDGGFITAADMRYHFFVTDHLGNVRVVVNDDGVVEQVNQFYPYGEPTDMIGAVDTEEIDDMDELILEPIDNPYKWSGKEWDEDQGAYDFGARMYVPNDARWTTMDPLCEKYYHISPYAYCAGNPVNLVDPDGKEVKGVTREDAAKVVQDLRAIFVGDEYKEFRNLITQSGKKQNGKSLAKISPEAMKKAFDGIELSTDARALVDMVVNTINSTDLHTIEYTSSDSNISSAGEDAFSNALSQAGLPMEQIIEKNGGIPASILSSFGGGGITTPTKRGSHTVIVSDPNLHPNGQPVTTGHELLGHGRSLALGMTGSSLQHVSAIQTENLILRVMGISFINDGRGHGPRTIIPNATSLPSYR